MLEQNIHTILNIQIQMKCLTHVTEEKKMACLLMFVYILLNYYHEKLLYSL